MNLQQLKRKKKKVLETLIRIQHRPRCSARDSCMYYLKHPQGIAQNKVTDDYNNDHYFSSPCQYSELKNHPCLELQSTLMKMQKTKSRISFYLGGEAV